MLRLVPAQAVAVWMTARCSVCYAKVPLFLLEDSRMNRILILGVAMFIAIVGIALVGGEKVAVAGHGCHGCCCGGDCCGGGCCGGDCCCCGGEAAPAAGSDKGSAPPPPAPMTSIKSDRAPFAFSSVSFRR